MMGAYKLCIRMFLIVFCSLYLSVECFSAPSVGNIEVEGEFLSGNQIVISGSSFGEGPNIILFDDFSGTVGQVINLSASVGSWSAASHSPVYIDDEGDNVAALLIDGIQGRPLHINFNPVTEVFISYRIRIPTGYHFPMGYAPKTFPDGSQWKLTWLMEHEKSYLGQNDLCVPTYPFGRFTISGNSGVPHEVGKTWAHFDVGRAASNTDNTRWFSFDGWNRFSAYLKGGIPDPLENPGTIWAQGMSEEFGIKEFGPADNYILMNNGEGFWSKLQVHGWYRPTDPDTRAIYDDVYLAIGANAQARVEIGNSSNYSDSTKLAILTPVDWTDNSITATIRQGGFNAEDEVFLFVIDANGHASSGYPLKIGSEDTGTPLQPPTSLKIGDN